MKKNRRIIKLMVAIVVLLCAFNLFSLSFQECEALEVLYERDFDGGIVQLEVSDRIIFSITVVGVSGFFCNVPKKIEQNYNTYEIRTDQLGEGYIKIDWSNFDGCGIIDPGQTAVGTISTFPLSFDIEESFRFYYAIDSHGLDYFEVTPGLPTTTTSLATTTSIPSGTTSTLTTTLFPPFCLIEQLYGEQAEETELLRYIRDNILTGTDEGRELIRLYYQWNRMLAETFQEDENFREDVKTFIDETITLIK